jgi:hypothetical protein
MSSESNIERDLGTMFAMLEQIQRQMQAHGSGQEIMQAGIDEVRATVASLQKDMEEVKPVTERITRLQSVGVGVLLTLGLIASAIGLTAATAREWFAAHFLK